MFIWQTFLCLLFLFVSCVNARPSDAKPGKDSASSESASNESAGGSIDATNSTLKQKPSENADSSPSNLKRFSRQIPIYGSVGYTTGQINNVIPVNTGYYNENYDSYSNNYWNCVNNFRGQYYFSYTIGYYVCDVRANRYG